MPQRFLMLIFGLRGVDYPRKYPSFTCLLKLTKMKKYYRSCTLVCQFFFAKFFGKLPLFANFWQTKVFGQCFFLNFQFLAKLEAAGFLDVFLTLEVPKLNSNDNYRGWALVVRLFSETSDKCHTCPTIFFFGKNNFLAWNSSQDPLIGNFSIVGQTREESSIITLHSN